MTEELIIKCIGCAAQCGNDELVKELTNELMLLNKPQPAHKSPNKSGVVQIDINTGDIIARYKTIKDANIALGKKENASGISDAINRSNTHIAYGYKWIRRDEIETLA